MIVRVNVGGGGGAVNGQIKGGGVGMVGLQVAIYVIVYGEGGGGGKCCGMDDG